MLDLENESIVSLAEAARTLPGGSVHISTIHRWRLKGIRGIRLETCLRAGRRVTSHEALARFFSRITADADGETPPTRTPAQRRRALESAERELSREGI